MEILRLFPGSVSLCAPTVGSEYQTHPRGSPLVRRISVRTLVLESFKAVNKQKARRVKRSDMSLLRDLMVLSRVLKQSSLKLQVTNVSGTFKPHRHPLCAFTDCEGSGLDR